MFLINAPDRKAVDQFLKDREQDRFSYAETGATRGDPPAGYNVDHNRAFLGDGAETFERAKAAIRNWTMFSFGWVKLFYDDTPIEVGRNVAMLVNHFGFYSLSSARVVYVIDETGEIERFGFAYGTLTAHVERGEERFMVEYNKATGEVWYDLYAFSWPASLLATIGYPVSRYLQRAFVRESKLAMQNAASTPGASPQIG